MNPEIAERRAMLLAGSVALVAGLALLVRPALATELIGAVAPDAKGEALLRWIGVLHAAIGLGYLGARTSRRGEFKRATLAFGGLFQIVTLLVGFAAAWHVAGSHLRMAGALGAFGIVQAGAQWMSAAWRVFRPPGFGFARFARLWSGVEDGDDSLAQARRWMAVLGFAMLAVGVGCLFTPQSWLIVGDSRDVWLLRWVGGFYVAAGLGHLTGFLTRGTDAFRARMEIAGLFQIVVGVLGFVAAKTGLLPGVAVYVAFAHLAAGLVQGHMLLEEEWRED